MHTTKRHQILSQILLVLKIAGAITVGFAAAVYSVFVILLGGPGVVGILFAWSFLLLGGVYIGIALPRAWYLAIAITWLPFFKIPSSYLFHFPSQFADATLWLYVFNTLLVNPIIALVSGYLGSRLQSIFHSEKAKQSRYLGSVLVTLLTVPPLLILIFIVQEQVSPRTTFKPILVGSIIALVSAVLGSRLQGVVHAEKAKQLKPLLPVLVTLLTVPLLLNLILFGLAPKPVHVSRNSGSSLLATPTPLQKAAEQGDLAKMNRLIEQGKDVNAKDNAGRTPLHYAVGAQNAAAVKLLLENGANPDAKDMVFGVTPLHWAVGSGNLEIVKLLAPRMKNINAVDNEDHTPADIAALDNNKAIVEVLIANGATVSNKH